VRGLEFAERIVSTIDVGDVVASQTCHASASTDCRPAIAIVTPERPLVHIGLTSNWRVHLLNIRKHLIVTPNER
jgi:hypothetical protein